MKLLGEQLAPRCPSEPGKLVHGTTARAGDVAGPGRFVLMEAGGLVLEMAT